jgi:protein phosphatase PTC7
LGIEMLFVSCAVRNQPKSYNHSFLSLRIATFSHRTPLNVRVCHQIISFSSVCGFSPAARFWEFPRRCYSGYHDPRDEDDIHSRINGNNINVSNEGTRNNPLSSAFASRTKLRVADVLKSIEENSQQKNYVVSHESMISDCIAHLVKEKISSALVVNQMTGNIEGIFTARDLLKCITKHQSQPKAGRTKDLTQAQHVTFPKQVIEYLNSTKITEVMASRDKLVYCHPSDSLARCREIMFQCKIRNLPVIDDYNIVKGILTMKIIADSSFNLMETGGKKGFIHNVTGRRGLPNAAKFDFSSKKEDLSGVVSLSDVLYLCSLSVVSVGSRGAYSHRLDLEVGDYALPHPFKGRKGVANNRRDYGAFELQTDLQFCEDSHFAIRLKDSPKTNEPNPLDVLPTSPSWLTTDENSVASFNLPLSVPNTPSQVYLCVADGVGSWAEYGIDPREYSHALVANAKKVIESDFVHRSLIGSSPFDRGYSFLCISVLSSVFVVFPLTLDLSSVHPLDIILDAWNLTTSEGIQGSATLCIATLDKQLNQLSYSNIGDCGLMVVRRFYNEARGSLRDKVISPNERKTDWKVAYISQQQLRSFNFPYQLGFSKVPSSEGGTVFETPNDADTASIPLVPGDIIILATDGLYDNLDLNEIVDVVHRWEAEHFPSTGNEGKEKDDIKLPSKTGNKAVSQLAERLVKLARELSLDTHRDSPFALLAKENDIMWGGGMPDDTTVIVGRVVSVP